MSPDSDTNDSAMSEPHSSVLLEYTTLLSDLKALEARAANYNKLAQEVNSEEAACLKELTAHRKKVKKVIGETRKVAEQDQGIGDLAASLKRKLQHVEYQFPRRPHILLRLALGNHAPFSLRPYKLRLEYKREYEVFKMRMTLISCVVTGIGWLLTTSRVLDAIFGFLLLYYYCTYQKQRLYVLVALDRARPMDTVAGEGFFSDQLEREFLLLTPFLVAGQVWQMYMSWMLTKLWIAQEEKEWQPIVAATLFGILGVGNQLTTIRTYLAKKTPNQAQLRHFPNSPASPPISPLVSPSSVTQNGEYFPSGSGPSAGPTVRQRIPTANDSVKE
ncbi:hypothetical protein HK097_011272 [Rhizophlyctis rosea]|uniref:Transmembrane protein 120 homolog n=1 Tax=Rhizophlyctis rosea TaxID=64517 RepID=A0AAD5X3U4_9FUNG|nr:hypothetical protein HK097_011272 [Rhizophlyctis rosea]